MRRGAHCYDDERGYVDWTTRLPILVEGCRLRYRSGPSRDWRKDQDVDLEGGEQRSLAAIQEEKWAAIAVGNPQMLNPLPMW
jgi:hypothetical protein